MPQPVLRYLQATERAPIGLCASERTSILSGMIWQLLSSGLASDTRAQGCDIHAPRAGVIAYQNAQCFACKKILQIEYLQPSAEHGRARWWQWQSRRDHPTALLSPKSDEEHQAILHANLNVPKLFLIHPKTWL